MAVGDAGFDADLDGLGVVQNLLALALLAAVLFVVDVAVALAGGAHLLGLRVHARPDHDHLLDDLAALAAGARLGVRATLAVATDACAFARVLEIHHLALVHILQGHLDLPKLRLSLLRTLRPASASTAAQQVEQVESATATTALILQTLHTIPVVNVPLLGIRQNLIRLIE